MPGPPQHVDQGREQRVGHPEETATPESRDSVRQRLTRLPDGHPSSPRNDDGSLKPPLPRLSDAELPLPDEMDDDGAEDGDDKRELDRGAGAAAREARADGPPGRAASGEAAGSDRDAGRTLADGAWEWKGLRLTPDQARIAERVHDRCRAAEGRDADGNYGERGLTPAMRRVESQLEHGHLVPDTEKYALKGPDRFNEKLAKLIRDEPDSTTQDLAGNINDGIRYTYVFYSDSYAAGVSRCCHILEGDGFSPRERKNAWIDESTEYRGINSSWRDPESGSLFEIQFHTWESWQAKQETHAHYEILESPRSRPEERAEARRRQSHIFAAVPVPPGVADISSYRTDG